MAPKNADCPLVAGSLTCMMMTWTEATLPSTKYTLFNTPCQSCPWWDEYAGEDE